MTARRMRIWSNVGADNGAAGIPVTDQTVIDACERCHAVDEDGLMTRISYLRKTPEGWQQSIRRMVTLNEAELDPETARAIVRYLSDKHGIAPEELRPGRFEVERRLIDWSYEADEDVENTCSQCHSMGRVITQRRTKEEWSGATGRSSTRGISGGAARSRAETTRPRSAK